MCVLSIKVPIQKKSGTLYIYIYIYILDGQVDATYRNSFTFINFLVALNYFSSFC